MGAVDRFTPVQALGGGAALPGANPKNLLLAAATAAAIAQTGIAGGQQAAAYAVFTVVGTLGVGRRWSSTSRWASAPRTCWLA